MANSDATHLENLKIARDAIVAGIAEGRLTIDYTINGRRHTVANPVQALEQLEKSIEIYERKTSVASQSRFRAASLSRPGGRG